MCTAKELDELERILSSLLVRRDSQEENRLCHIARKLSDDEKKSIIELLAKKISVWRRLLRLG